MDWTLVKGNSLSVQLRYSVLKKFFYDIEFFFVVEAEGEMNPAHLALYFRNLFFHNVFANIFSDEARWVSTTVVHSEGRLKLSEDAVNFVEEKDTLGGSEDIENEKREFDADHRLRISFARYNQNTPIFFFLYGIRRNQLDWRPLARTFLEMSREAIEIPVKNKTENLVVRFAGLTNSSQVTTTHYIVEIQGQLQLLPEKQKMKFIPQSDGP